MSTPIAVQLNLDVIACCKCGVLFGIAALHSTHLQETHDTFYCPAGHPQHFTAETEAEKLRRQLLQRNTELTALEADRAQLAKQVLKKEKQLRQAKKRIHAGVCLFCHRHFTNVERHMETQHPNIEAETGKQVTK